jgi:[acyl-carrier-protein] S-malonyltransferase
MGADDTRLAAVFPGQGIGDPALHELVDAERPDLGARARELVGDDPFARIGEGTRFAQPAVYCATLAGFERLGRPPAGLYAGHSMGEITALAAAGAIDEGDGLRIVVERGRLMAVAALAGPAGGMLAVGGDRPAAEELASRCGLTVANENSPRQFVLSGEATRLDVAEREAKGAGLRAKRLAVRGAFHSPAMRPAVEPFHELLGTVEFRPPPAPVLSCVTAQPFGAHAADALAAALTSPVRWVDVLHGLRDGGAERFLDVGPGKVLAGLVKRTLEGAAVEAGARREVQHA